MSNLRNSRVAMSNLGVKGHVIECMSLVYVPIYTKPRGGGGAGTPTRDLICLHLNVATTWWLKTDTNKVHILMIEKVSFNEFPMKSKTRPGFLHIYTFESLALISFNYLLENIY